MENPFTWNNPEYGCVPTPLRNFWSIFRLLSSFFVDRQVFTTNDFLKEKRPTNGQFCLLFDKTGCEKVNERRPKSQKKIVQARKHEYWGQLSSGHHFPLLWESKFKTYNKQRKYLMLGLDMWDDCPFVPFFVAPPTFLCGFSWQMPYYHSRIFCGENKRYLKVSLQGNPKGSFQGPLLISSHGEDSPIRSAWLILRVSCSGLKIWP